MNMTNEINKENKYTILQTLKFFYKSLENHKLLFVICLIGFAIASSLYFVATYLFSKVIDELSTKGTNFDQQTLFLLASGVIICYAFDKIFRTVSSFYVNKIQIITQASLKQRSFDKLAAFDLSWHQSKNSGAKVEKINSGIQGYKNLFQSLEWSIIWNVVNMIIPLGFFIILGYKYLLVLTFFAVIMISFNVLIQKRINNNDKNLEDLQEVGTNKFFEFSNNIVTIKALNAVNVFKSTLFKNDQAREKVQLQNNLLKSGNTLFRNLGEIIIIDTCLLILLLGDYKNNLITLGTLQLAFTNSWSITWAILNFSKVIQELNEAQTKISRLIPFFEEKPKEYFHNKNNWDDNWHTLQLKNLSFDYTLEDVNRTALNDVNLVIERNKKYGFVGHSGSGKSTLTKILMGLYPIKSGSINFISNNKLNNFYDFSQDEVRSKIAIVLQETELFDLSFRDNLTLMKKVDPILLEKAINIAQLSEVLDKLPSGLDTNLGEKGYKLSGGEKQRLGIARAIIADSDILIFDEATSALDSITENKIQKALESELTDKTLIIVAHRLSTLKNTDCLYVFSKGDLIESGSFESLVGQKSYFAKLWQKQQSHVQSNL
jgi:ATP-binding cassette, subfamily B, bacterial